MDRTATATNPIPSSAEERARAVVVPERRSARHAADLTAARDGDRNAMDRLVQDLTPLVWHVARSSGCARHEAEDVVQNTWYALFSQLDKIRDSQALVGWLITTARRNAARIIRGEMQTVQLSDEMAERVESTLPTPEAEALRNEHNRQVWRAFTRLSHRDQKLLRLLVIDRESHQDVARALGLSAGSVGPLRGRALRRLRELLKNDEEEAA